MAESKQLYEAVSREIDAQRTRLAEEIVARHYSEQPDLATRYGPTGREKCLQDVNGHLAYLAQSIAVSTPNLFSDYIAWAKEMLSSRTVPGEHLAANLVHLRDVLQRFLLPSMQAIALQYVDAGLEECRRNTLSSPSFLAPAERHVDLARRYLDALLAMDRQSASILVLDAVRAGVNVTELYIHVFQRSQEEIGRLWQLNQVSVAQEHFCTAATQLIMSQLYPHIFTGEKNGRTLVAAGVAGDLHELGVRMVADFFEIAGWKTIYLGANTPAQGIVKLLIDHKADVLALSTTMTYHIRPVVDTIKAVRLSEAKHIKILVGGYPFNRSPDLWAKVGADGHARDASAAVILANDLLMLDAAKVRQS